MGFLIDIVYTDYRKAFDKISHAKLELRVRQYGFGEKLIKWIKASLSERSQRVVLDEAFSIWISVFSGVPQGSVLGPLLFIIYVNEMLELVQNDCEAYADDTKIISVIKNLMSHIKLQDDIDQICKWSNQWSTVLNTEKCKVLGKSNLRFDYEIFSNNGHKYVLGKSDCEKDLGIFIESDLKWEVQVAHCTSKTNR